MALAVALAVLGTGLMEIGDYEERLKFCRRGTELARKTHDLLVLWLHLDSLGQACGGLPSLREARRVHDGALELGALGPQYEMFSSIRPCRVAALSGTKI